MITVEEARKRFAQGEFVAGMEPLSDFSFTARVDRGAEKNMYFVTEINKLLNSNLNLGDYSSNLIKHFTITFLIYPAFEGEGVNWQERKYFKRKEKTFFIDIRFPNYEQFRKADKQKALQIMAEQTLRGTKKFLPKVEDFDSEKFYSDLVTLFKSKGFINKKQSQRI
jgi:hypothetical protein